jgi:hypothetical protein
MLIFTIIRVCSRKRERGGITGCPVSLLLFFLHNLKFWKASLVEGKGEEGSQDTKVTGASNFYTPIGRVTSPPSLSLLLEYTLMNNLNKLFETTSILVMIIFFISLL